MKLKLILLLTLSLNVLLASLWWPHEGKTPRPVVRKTPAAAAPPVDAVVSTNSATNVIAFRWEQVETDDFRKFIANLRALGCPERVIREVVIDELEKIYRHQQIARVPARNRLEPWAGRDRINAANRADQVASSARDEEVHALIRELFGIEWKEEAYRNWNDEAIVGVILGFLSDEKAPQVMTLVERCGDKARRIRDEADGILIPEDFRRLNALGDELFASLGLLLQPPELEELQLRAQGFMVSMEGDHQFETLDLTGIEMREICRASLTLTDVLREEIIHIYENDRGEEEQARRKAEFEKRLAQILGPDRFAEYQLAADSDYRDIAVFLREHQQPKGPAIGLAAAFSKTRERAGQIRRDKTLSEEERRVALAVLGAALNDRIKAALGPNAGEFIKNHGQLLNELVPPAKTEAGK